GQFLTNLLVGVGRYHRGERLSGRMFVKEHALRHLVMLIEAHIPSAGSSVLDDLDPLRRFEWAYPELGEDLDRILEQETPTAARMLLELAVRELCDRIGEFPRDAVDAIARTIEA